MHRMPTKGTNYMMSPLVAWNSWNMTHFDTKLKAFATFSWKTTQSRWRSKMHLMSWIIVSHSPLVATPNWCGEKCVAKTLQNWRHKMWLVNWYNISHTTLRQTPVEGLVMAKRWTTPKICCNSTWNVTLCNMRVKLKQLWESIHEIFWVKTISEVFETIPKGSFANKLDIHWNVNLKELNESSSSWSSLYFFWKNGKNSFDSGCKMVKTKVLSKDVGVGENGAKKHVAWESSHAC